MRFPSNSVIFATVMILVGLGAITYGSVYYFTNQWVPFNYVRTTGTVIRITPVRRVSQLCNKYGCNNLISYTDTAYISYKVGSATYEMSENLGEVGDNTYVIGKVVGVAYSPSSPGSNAIDTSDPLNKYVGPIFGGAGALCIILGLVVLRIRRKSAPTDAVQAATVPSSQPQI